MPKSTRQEFYEEATRPVSDLESIVDELDEVLSRSGGTSKQREKLEGAIIKLTNVVNDLMTLDEK